MSTSYTPGQLIIIRDNMSYDQINNKTILSSDGYKEYSAAVGNVVPYMPPKINPCKLSPEKKDTKRKKYIRKSSSCEKLFHKPNLPRSNSMNWRDSPLTQEKEKK